MSILAHEEVQKIIKLYKELGSIKKVADKTGHSKVTVNKYVNHLSSKDKRSRYNNTPVIQMNSEGKAINEYKNSNQASKETSISLSSISQCLNGRIKTAGGFKWSYKKQV